MRPIWYGGDVFWLLILAQADPPEIGEKLPELSDKDRQLAIEGVADAARKLLDRPDDESALPQAVALLRHHWRKDPKSVPLNLLLAEAHVQYAERYEAKEDKEARKRHIDAGRTHCKAAPDHGEALYWHGHLLLHSADIERSYGRLKEALAEMEKAERSAPDTDLSGPARMIGRIYQETPSFLMLGDTKKAYSWYETALKRAPQSLQTRLWMVQVCIELDKYKEARQHIEFIDKAKPRTGREKQDKSYQEEARGLLGKIQEEE
jgi:tetratricopeptide (TPR) repeat protein